MQYFIFLGFLNLHIEAFSKHENDTLINALMNLKLAELFRQLIKYFLRAKCNVHDFLSRDPFRKANAKMTSLKAVEISRYLSRRVTGRLRAEQFWNPPSFIPNGCE
jgi:hypothetical protein